MIKAAGAAGGCAPNATPSCCVERSTIPATYSIPFVVLLAIPPGF